MPEGGDAVNLPKHWMEQLRSADIGKRRMMERYASAIMGLQRQVRDMLLLGYSCNHALDLWMSVSPDAANVMAQQHELLT